VPQVNAPRPGKNCRVSMTSAAILFPLQPPAKILRKRNLPSHLISYIRLAETGRNAGYTPPGENRGMNSGELEFRRGIICYLMVHLFKAL